jgi:hypothetical protein
VKENTILEQLRNIPHGTFLKIMWLDASTVQGARLNKIPLPNYYVETRRTTVGSCVALQIGQAQKAYHLVLEMDNTEGTGSMIRSIPVCLIYKIIAASAKKAESTERKGFKPSMRGLLKRRAKSLLRLRDGSVKLFDR